MKRRLNVKACEEIGTRMYVARNLTGIVAVPSYLQRAPTKGFAHLHAN